MKPTDAGTIGGRFGDVWEHVYHERLPANIAREYADDLLALGKIVYRNRIITRERSPPP